MATNTQIMIQRPSATHLLQIPDLWLEMQQELAQNSLEKHGSEALQARKAKYERQLRQWYQDPAVFMLIGVRMMGDERAGEVVAYMIARLEEGEGPPRLGRLVDLYVRPSLRGNNLAKNMVEAASGWLRVQGCEYLEASTLTSNRSGMAFLASTQFQLYSSVLRKPL